MMEQPPENDEDLLDTLDEKYLRVFFENIQSYRQRREESSQVTLPIVAGWALSAAHGSTKEARQVLKKAATDAENQKMRAMWSKLTDLLPVQSKTNPNQNEQDSSTDLQQPEKTA
jgi:hypothetical protein